MNTNKFAQIAEELRSKYVGRTIRCLKPIFEDGYFDTGMIADVVSVVPDSEGGDLFKIFLNYEKYRTHNLAIESQNKNWYLNGGGLGTATEAGFYPENHEDCYYIEVKEVSDVEQYISILQPTTLEDQLIRIKQLAENEGLLLAVDFIDSAMKQE